MASASSTMRVPLVFDSAPAGELPAELEIDAEQTSSVEDAADEISAVLEAGYVKLLGRDWFIPHESINAFLADRTSPVRVVCLTPANILQHVKAIRQQRGDNTVQVHRKDLADVLLPPELRRRRGETKTEPIADTRVRQRECEVSVGAVSECALFWCYIVCACWCCSGR